MRRRLVRGRDEPRDGRGFGPCQVAVADYNKDGNPDLAVANSGADNGTMVRAA
ncbi:FG-GAP repeat protein [Micromonospora sp. DT44]|uniref:FG-GAP repeat protein n=1 Tax=Micromonospora sp. DT44 TaxID=3393439 RepID=UPI003CFAB7E5